MAHMENEKEYHEQLVKSYLKALEGRDMDTCMSFFAAGAVIHFMEGVYQGEQDIRQWHKDRFEAELQINEIEGIQHQGDTITVQAVISSNRLRAWKIRQLSGYARARIQDGKIQELTFGPSVTNPLEDWS